MTPNTSPLITNIMTREAGKKPLLIVHIGGGKTGSSAIQVFLAKNRRNLASFGVLVPNAKMNYADGAGNQVFHFQDLIDVPEAGRLLKSQLNTAIAKFRHEQNSQHGPKAIVISAENLSNDNGLHQVFDYFRKDFELAVVFYLRRQEDFYLAAWQQWYAKTGKEVGPWLRKTSKDFGDWDGVINRWDSLVPDHFVVRIYEPSCLICGDVIKDFCAMLGLETTDFDLERGKTNESFGVHISSLYHDIAPFFESIHDRRVETILYRYQIAAATKQPNETVFTQEELTFIRDKHTEGNHRIKARFFADNPESNLFPELDLEKMRLPSQDEINRRNLAVLSELIFKHIIESQKNVSELQASPTSSVSKSANEQQTSELAPVHPFGSKFRLKLNQIRRLIK